MNNPNAILHGLPLPPPLPLPSQQQQNAARIGQHQQQQQQQQRQQQEQQHRHQQYTQPQPHQPQYPANSPHISSTSQGQFVPSHPPPHNLVQHPSSYAAAQAPALLHHPTDPGLFNAHPSPYSTNSAAGSYTSSDANDAMAQATMSRQAYPPITSLQTPQSQSPASMHSPHHDASGRGALYAYPPMGQPMYYPQSYQGYQPTSYAQQAASTPSHAYPPVSSSPGGMMMHHQQHHTYAPHQAHTLAQPQPGVMDSKPSQPSIQRSASVIPPPPLPPPPNHSQSHQPPLQQQQTTPQTPSGPIMHNLTLASSTVPNPAAAPGPIPATTPLVVREDHNGTQWIAFEYSRDRVKMEYTIRCDVENVKVDELSQEFKSANCVYPRACGGKEAYKGNRLQYETECNSVGWALAQLNPCLREKRGLIQRAVDSWRNSNRDMRLRSRRVRRQAKISSRKAQSGSGAAASATQTSGSSSSSTMQAPLQIPPSRSASMAHLQMHHHGDAHDGRGSDVSEQHYHSAGSVHQQRQQVTSAGLPVPSSIRYTQSFYPQLPQHPGIGSSTMPSIHDSMNSIGQHASTTLATPITASVKDEDEDSKRALFGDVPEAKRRKFILVDDNQRGTRVRVRVMLDQVKMEDMPDAHLRINAVFPRSYFPRQVSSPTGSPRSRGIWEDDEDSLEHNSQRGKTFVPVKNVDGEDKLAVPRMTRARRSNEVALNELGYRMSWGQARTFNGRTLFLQRSLDAYRGKIRHTMTTSGQEAESVSSHFELRPGKRKFMDRGKRDRRDSHAS